MFDTPSLRIVQTAQWIFKSMMCTMQLDGMAGRLIASIRCVGERDWGVDTEVEQAEISIGFGEAGHGVCERSDMLLEPAGASVRLSAPTEDGVFGIDLVGKHLSIIDEPRGRVFEMDEKEREDIRPPAVPGMAEACFGEWRSADAPALPIPTDIGYRESIVRSHSRR
jgi:hypothetical protein